MVSEELTREFFHTRDERLIRKLSEISQVISYKTWRRVIRYWGAVYILLHSYSGINVYLFL